MKLRILGLEVKVKLSIRRVKRIEISIPDWADDAHFEEVPDWIEDMEPLCPQIIYYKGCQPYNIPVPECTNAGRVVTVYRTPLRNRKIEGWPYNTNRKIVLDIYK